MRPEGGFYVVYVGVLIVILFLAIGYSIKKSHKITQSRNFASTPEEIRAMISEAAKKTEAKGPTTYPDPMLAPWEVMPDEPMPSMAWKMGSGEDYRIDFAKWFRSLSDEKQLAYMEANPEPEEWHGYFSQLRVH